ncbi:hypothetical protein K4H04_25615, partial [Mycobacterium tuberculosis]|nr:hypothetical protein [Mycobacterium tuberculosis]
RGCPEPFDSVMGLCGEMAVGFSLTSPHVVTRQKVGDSPPIPGVKYRRRISRFDQEQHTTIP